MEITPVKPSASYAHASSEKEASCHEGKSSSFSLELVLKKREILQTEATRLEKYQQARTELMCLLRQKHEALVTQNGSMEQLLKCRKDKLALLQKRLQDASHSDSDVTIEDSASLNENLRLCGDILSHLQLYSEKLERASLENEEELQLLIQSMHVIFTSYVEMNEMKRMLAEEIRTVAIELALAKQATTAREDHLNSISVQLETDRLIMKRRDEELEDIRLELTDKRVVAENMTRMGVEDLLAQHQRLDTAHTYLVVSRSIAFVLTSVSSELRVTEDLMRKSGAALPEDFEVEATVRALTDKHTKLGTVIVESKVEKREALMRRKQEQDLHSILQANIGAREDQLSWMKQQYSHLTKEIEFLTEAKRVQREAFDQYRQGYIQQVADIEQQLDNIAEEGKVVSIALESETVEMARLKTGAEEHLIELKAEQARHASKSDDLGCINAQKDANSAVARGLSDSIEDTRVKIYRLAERVSSIQLASEDELMRQYHLQEQIASVDREVVALDEARRDLIGKAGARINELKRQKILNQSPIKDTMTKKTITPPHPGQTALEQWELLKPKNSRGRSKPAAEKKRYPKPAPKISRGKTKRASTSDVDPSLSQAPSEKVQVGRLEAALHSEEPKVINAPTQQKKNETPAVRPKPRATKKTKALVLSQTLRTKARKPIDWAADESFSFS